MKYKLTEEFKKKSLKSRQISMSINYGIGAIVLIALLIIRYNDADNSLIITLLGGLIALPLAWIFFNNYIKKELSAEYEVSKDDFIIYINGQVRKKIPLISSKLKASRGGYIIESNHGSAFIPEGIENKEGLLEEIKVTAISKN